MSDRYITKQKTPAATTREELYKVELPATTTVGGVDTSGLSASVHVQTVITGLVICEASGNSITYQVDVETLEASAPGTITYIVKDKTLGASGTDILHFGGVLAPDTAVNVYSSRADTDFTLFGIETRTEGGPSG